MILSVHAIFGAAVASLVPAHPVMGFTLGFASHLALDAIPHKDYDLISVESDANKSFRQIDTTKKFKIMRDIIFVSLDALAGFYLAFLFFFDSAYPWIFFLGALGSLIPDFLTFLYLVFKRRSLLLFFNFHSSIIHSKNVLRLNQVAGVLLQFCTVSILIAILLGVKQLFISY